MDRTQQANYIKNLAGDMSSAMPSEVKPSDAKEVVEWWMSEDNFEVPEWWSSHDLALLIKWVADGLRDRQTNPENHKCHECGNLATIYDINPYLEELHPGKENPEEWFCDLCYQQALDDI